MAAKWSTVACGGGCSPHEPRLGKEAQWTRQGSGCKVGGTTAWSPSYWEIAEVFEQEILWFCFWGLELGILPSLPACGYKCKLQWKWDPCITPIISYPPSTCWRERPHPKCKLVQPLWKTIPHKTKNKVTIWSSYPTPGHIPRKNYNSKRYRHPYVHGSTVHRAKMRKPPKCPSANQRIKRTWYIHTLENYSAVEKNEMPFAATWMQLEMIAVSAVSQREKDK